MTPKDRKDLSYGILGEAIYDTESREWSFQRKLGLGRTLQATGSSRLVLSAAKQDIPAHTGGANIERKRKVETTVSEDPLLAPSSSLISHLAQVSEAIVNAPIDSTVSDLLAFGTARRLGNSRQGREPILVIAVAAGPNGDAVEIIRLRNDRYLWEARPDRAFILPVPQQQEIAWWTGPTVDAVQQVCFSEDVEGQPRNWLAIRNARGTSILRPVRRRKLVLSAGVPDEASGDSKSYPPSCLDPNQKVEILATDTGGASHVNVSFNPWYDHQIGILDSTGAWTVFEIEGKCSDIIKNVCSGSPPHEHSSVDHNLALADSWGVILWVGGPTTIMVVTRKTCRIHTIGDKGRSFNIPKLDLDSTTEIILDMKRSLSDPSHVFLLTTLRILWLQVCGDAGFETIKENEVAAKLLLSWRHHRSCNDHTLRMCLSPDIGPDKGLLSTSDSSLGFTDTILAMVFSRETDVTTCFTFAFDQSTKTGCSVSDPFGLQLRGNAKSAISFPRISLAMTLRPVYMVQPLLEARPVGTDEQISSGYRLFYLYQLGEDLSIVERLYVLAGSLTPETLASPFTLVSRENIQATEVVVDEDFIVADGLLAEKTEGIQDSTLSTTEWQQSMRWDGPRTMDCEWLAKELQLRMDIGQQDQRPANEIGKMLQEAFTDNARFDTGLHILSELLSANISVPQINKVSNAIQETLNTIFEGTYQSQSLSDKLNDNLDYKQLRSSQLLASEMLQSMHDPSSESEQRGSDLLALSVYEALLNAWIVPLNADVPGRTRIMLERELRNIAVQLTISFHGVQAMSKHGSEMEALVSDPIAGDDLILPIRRKASLQGRQATHSMQPITQSKSFDLHRKMNSQYRSNTSQAVMVSEGEVTRAQPLLGTLRNYTTTAEPKKIRPSSTKVLNQWRVGEDPARFDWDIPRHAATGHLDILQASDQMLRRRKSSAIVQNGQLQQDKALGSQQLAEGASEQRRLPPEPTLVTNAQAAQEAPPSSSFGGPSIISQRTKAKKPKTKSRPGF